MKKKEIQVFTARLPYETWRLLRMMAVKKDQTMSKIIIDMVEKQRKKYDDGLDTK